MTATIRDKVSDNTIEIRAKYVVGADGGRTVGPMIGIATTGPTKLITQIGVHFEADLSKYYPDVLIVREAGKAWVSATAEASDEARVPLRCVVVGREGNVRDAEARWEALSQTDADGAVLVRPDNFVAWRSKSMSKTPAKDLEQALRRIVEH